MSRNVGNFRVTAVVLSALSLTLSLVSPEGQFHRSSLIGIGVQIKNAHQKCKNMMAFRMSLFSVDWSSLSHDTQRALCLAADWCHFSGSLLLRCPRKLLLTHWQFVKLLVLFCRFFVGSFGVQGFSVQQRWIVVHFRETRGWKVEVLVCHCEKRGSNHQQMNQTKRSGPSTMERICMLCYILQSKKHDQ